MLRFLTVVGSFIGFLLMWIGLNSIIFGIMVGIAGEVYVGLFIVMIILGGVLTYYCAKKFSNWPVTLGIVWIILPGIYLLSLLITETIEIISISNGITGGIFFISGMAMLIYGKMHSKSYEQS